MNPEYLQLLVTRDMPYGKDEGRLIANLPGNYLNSVMREINNTLKEEEARQLAIAIRLAQERGG